MAKASSKATIEPKAEESSAAPAAPPEQTTAAPPEAPPAETTAAPPAEAPPEAAPPVESAPIVPPVLDPPEAEAPPPVSVLDLMLSEVKRAMSAFTTPDQLLLEMRSLTEKVADGPIPPDLSDVEAAMVIDAIVAECRQTMDALSAPRAVRREIDEHLRRLLSRARRLDAPPPKPVLYFEVTATSRFVIDGTITTLHAGSVISSLTHTIADVEAQKVPLRRCGAPQAMPSSSASGFQVSPTRDFEIVEHSDPLLRALGSRS